MSSVAHQLPQESSRNYEARFKGDGLDYFLLLLKDILLSIVTLGIYAAWARQEQRRYLWQSTYLDGHPFRFTGTGWELFRGYLIAIGGLLAWGVVTAILMATSETLGILWYVVSLIGAFAVLLPMARFGAGRYLASRTVYRGIRFGRDTSKRGEFVGAYIFGGILTGLTFGLYSPVMENDLHRIATRATHYGDYHFKYDGSGSEAFMIGFKGLLLSIFTLGLYLPWYIAEFHRFTIRHTSFPGVQAHSTLRGSDVFVLILLNLFGTTLTLGLATPWIAVHTLKTVAYHLRIEGSIDFAAIEQTAQAGTATAEGVSDALEAVFDL